MDFFLFSSSPDDDDDDDEDDDGDDDDDDDAPFALKESSSASCRAPRQSTPPNSWSKYIVETFPHASTSAVCARRTSGSGLARNLICSVPSEGGAVLLSSLPPLVVEPEEEVAAVPSWLLFDVVTTAGGAEGSGMPEEKARAGSGEVRDAETERARAAPPSASFFATARAATTFGAGAGVVASSALLPVLPLFFASARCLGAWIRSCEAPADRAELRGARQGRSCLGVVWSIDPRAILKKTKMI